MTRPTVIIKPIICKNESGNGYLPGVVVNRMFNLTTYSAVGYDRSTAEEMAIRQAATEANRYIGDWSVSIQTGAIELVDSGELRAQ